MAKSLFYKPLAILIIEESYLQRFFHTLADIAKSGFVGAQDYDNQVAVPFIALYDGVYTYDKNLAEGWNK